jgi:hypothetical protein
MLNEQTIPQKSKILFSNLWFSFFLSRRDTFLLFCLLQLVTFVGRRAAFGEETCGRASHFALDSFFSSFAEQRKQFGKDDTYSIDKSFPLIFFKTLFS